MYQPSGNNQHYQYYEDNKQYGSHPMTSKSPPPLQHPVPQHPIPNFNSTVHHTPSPGLGQQQQQQQQHYQQYLPQQSTQQPQPQQGYQPHHYAPGQTTDAFYSQFNLNDPAAQMGMHFAGNAMAQGTAYMERNFNRWVNMPALRHYFNVNNLYVVNKLKLLIFPWRHSSWTRSIKRTETGQMDGFRPPRDDINSPDLYIPVMAVVTYVLMCGLVAGRQGSFHPEKLYVAGSTSVAIVFFEIMFTRLGCYFMNIPFEASIMDLVAYYGYKFVAIIVTDVVKLLSGSGWISWAVFFYTGLSVGFFLLRSMRYVILPDASAGPSTLNPQRKRRMWFLLMIAALQLVYMFFLIN
ncbi:YIF1-domain-containing protein [Halteromyces radiatus]|uniref:YIF1-domain-containing protein n=1 Tax=Halteromyces radiatus TaxID=101107 RepID=UPI00221F921C|nr:YIF1-domain-containing protein [Halteromyces radiatus]KAI8092543.1 YIF1-domain-containing protein [Halteromyces radiatus]